MAEPIVVIGAGGFGRETLDVIEAINEANVTPVWDVVGVIDDSPSALHLSRVIDRGYSHLGALNDAAVPDDCSYVIGIGSPTIRAQIAARIDARGGRWATLVHPTAVIGSRVAIGHGSVVCGGTQISTNVQLGTHVHINPSVTIGHDVLIGSFVSINPGAIVSGEVTVSAGALLGAGSTVLQGLTIGSASIVGAAACVTRDVVDAVVVKGIPAR